MPHATRPTRATDGAVGYDLTSIQSIEESVQQLGTNIEKLEKGINSLTQVFLESKSWNKEGQQLKSIEGILQQLKRVLVE